MREYDINKNLDPVQTNVKENVRNGVTALKTTVPLPAATKLPGGTVMPKPGDALVNNPILGVETKDAINNAEGLTTGQKFMGAGVDALGQAPSIINNLSSKPQSREEATGKVLSLASSGAKIGANFGPWGAGIGAVVGAGAGILKNEGWRGEMTEQADRELALEQENKRKALIDDYVNQHTSKQIEAQKNLLSSTLGYTQNS